MNLEDIAASLPNGLHDLFVDRLSIDFAGGVATLEVSVWTGDLDSSSESERDAYRPALLVLEGLQSCIFDPPDPSYPYAEPGALWLVDLLDADPVVSGRYVLPPAPSLPDSL